MDKIRSDSTLRRDRSSYIYWWYVVFGNKVSNQFPSDSTYDCWTLAAHKTRNSNNSLDMLLTKSKMERGMKSGAPRRPGSFHIEMIVNLFYDHSHIVLEFLVVAEIYFVTRKNYFLGARMK